MSDVASGTFLRIEVPVILRYGRLKHRRAEIGCVREVLSVCVIGENAEAACVSAPHVDISCVVPALRRVLEPVHRANRNCVADHGGSGWKNSAGQEGCNAVGTPRLSQTRTRKRIIDQMSTLQMKPANTLITDLNNGLAADCSLDRSSPLLDILRLLVGIESSEARHGLADDRRSEIQ